MKRVFIEPMVRRIEININENIANSNPGQVIYALQESMTEFCFIQDTKFNYLDVYLHKVTEDQLINCATYVQSKIRGVTYVTRQELFG